MFNYWLKSRSGNVAIISALVLLPVLLIAGAGVDYMRAVSAKSRLQAALEGGALAAASLKNNRDPEMVVTEYIQSNLASDPELSQNVIITVTPGTNNAINRRTISVTAQANIQTHFIKLAGYEFLTINADSSATQNASNIEISLVLDISSSMRGSKITNLKNASQGFVERVLDGNGNDFTSINLVPFGGSVNLGELYDDVVVDTGSAIVNPSEVEYNIGANGIENGNFRWPAVGDACIEMREEDFDDRKIPNNSRAQVPPFWKWQNFNPWCPTTDSAIMTNTNDVDDLKDHLDDLTLSDGTGMDIGAAWGLKLLSPALKNQIGGDFSDRPADYTDDDTSKSLIIMSDGNITNQRRPQDPTRGNVHVNNTLTNNTVQGTSTAVYNGAGQDQNEQDDTPYPEGTITDLSTDHTAIGHFKKICEDAKANDITIFTIGFQISAGSIADQLLAECASDPSKYYFVETLDINSAFQSIASTITALRISG